MIMKEDDPVVEEFQVYLSNTLAKKLFVYQFPVQSRYINYDENVVLKSSIKPEHQEVRMELEINTESPNYDASKGEQIALNVDGAGANKKKEEDRHFQSSLMDKQVLESARAVMDASRYAIGVFHENEFHLTSLQGIVHMHPSFAYLDKSDKRAKELAKELGEGEHSDDDEEEAKQITVKFARQENERIKRARERSFGYLSKKSAEEPWCHTQYYGPHTERAELERNKLYCAKVSEKPAELNLSVKEYMKDLVPQTHDQVVTPSSLSSVVIPLRRLRQCPLVDQVKHLLQEAKLIPFSQLLSLLGKDQDAVNVLRAVQQVAVLVQGNWVVRSDILYPKDSVSDTSGIPAELMCRGRDYILYLFTQHQYINRLSVSSVVKIPGEELKAILQQISRLRVNKGWELLLPYDKDFINRYPEVSQRQQKIWEAKLKQLSDIYGDVQSVTDKEVADRKEVLCNKSENETDNAGNLWQQKNCSIRKLAKRTIPPAVAIKIEPMDT